MTQAPSRPYMGAYMVQGHDAVGPWAYPGKGDPVRAHASMHGRNGQTVTILAAGISEAEAFTVECAVMVALKEAGVRLVNATGGHGIQNLAPAVVLAARLNAGGTRRQLTLGEVGPALMFPTNLLHGHAVGDVRQSVFRQWILADAAVRQIRRLLRCGQQIRVLAVAPSGIVVGSYLLLAIKTFPADHPAAGLRYLTLVEDPDAELHCGHTPPVPRQQGVRYLTPNGAGVTPFLALP